MFDVGRVTWHLLVLPTSSSKLPRRQQPAAVMSELQVSSVVFSALGVQMKFLRSQIRFKGEQTTVTTCNLHARYLPGWWFSDQSHLQNLHQPHKLTDAHLDSGSWVLLKSV